MTPWHRGPRKHGRSHRFQASNTLAAWRRLLENAESSGGVGKLNYTDAKFLGDVKTEATGCQPFVHRSAFVLCSFGASVMSHHRDTFATVCENQRVVMHARQQKQAEKSRKKLSEAASDLQHAKQQNLLLEEQIQIRIMYDRRQNRKDPNRFRIE